jgi:hypothetical protein
MKQKAQYLPASVIELLVAVFFLLFSTAAHAQCTGPAGTSGQIVYSQTSSPVVHVPLFCDGAQWRAMAKILGTGGGGCSSPTGVEGNIMYNNHFHALLYCDGTLWHAMGPTWTGAAGGGCTSPTGAEGNIIVNSGGAPQYCDSKLWHGTGFTSPSTIAFTNQTDVPFSTVVTSNAVTLTGGGTGMTATCGVGCTDIIHNGVDCSCTSLAGINSGDTIAIKQTSAAYASYSTPTTATITVGDTISSPWTVTTWQQCTLSAASFANNIVPTANQTISYALYGGGGASSLTHGANNVGSPGSYASGTVAVTTAMNLSVYVGGGGGVGGQYSGGGGGSGWYGGGGGGIRAVDGCGGGGGSTAIVNGATVLAEADGGSTTCSNSAESGGGTAAAGGAGGGGSFGSIPTGFAGGLHFGGGGGTDTNTPGAGGTGASGGTGGTAGGGGGGYGSGGGEVGYNGGSNGGASGSGEAGDSTGAGSSSGSGGLGGSGVITYGAATCNWGSPQPVAFSFTNVTGQLVSSTVLSNAVTLSWSGGGTLTATCGSGCTGISINGGSFVAGPVAGVASGDTIAIRQVSSASHGTLTTASVIVGTTASSIWDVTTGLSCSLTVTSTHNFTPTINQTVSYTLYGGGGGGDNVSGSNAGYAGAVSSSTLAVVTSKTYQVYVGGGGGAGNGGFDCGVTCAGGGGGSGYYAGGGGGIQAFEAEGGGGGSTAIFDGTSVVASAAGGAGSLGSNATAQATGGTATANGANGAAVYGTASAGPSGGPANISAPTGGDGAIYGSSPPPVGIAGLGGSGNTGGGPVGATTYSGGGGGGYGGGGGGGIDGSNNYAYNGGNAGANGGGYPDGGAGGSTGYAGAKGSGSDEFGGAGGSATIGYVSATCTW